MQDRKLIFCRMVQVFQIISSPYPLKNILILNNYQLSIQNPYFLLFAKVSQMPKDITKPKILKARYENSTIKLFLKMISKQKNSS